ncbi:CB1 cannabinoid receptor-interacting protein 1 [Apodemus speciosus]|uniref:CB1 cannabinoid receptor-interacting protein 1 n=1 Tax=Apodemus speciosus TaxID=105296 RepID=A0ABQ0F976_APOSI
MIPTEVSGIICLGAGVMDVLSHTMRILGMNCLGEPRILLTIESFLLSNCSIIEMPIIHIIDGQPEWPLKTQFTDIGTFETVWQVKFYNYHKRDHCQWGSPFSVIEYECKPNETRSLMWVNKESFL